MSDAQDSARSGNFGGLRPYPVLLAIAFGVAVGTIILLLTGKNPLDAYSRLVVGALAPANLPDMLNWAVPIVGMTMVAALPLRAGMLNLGGDGQMLVGGMVAATVPLYLPFTGAPAMAITIVAAMFAAGCYALLAAWGEISRGVPMLVTSLLLNYPAAGITSYLATFTLRDMSSGLAQTVMIPDADRLPMLFDPLNLGVILMVAVVAIVIFVDRRTVFGYEVRMRGLNPLFARYGGIDLASQAYTVMLFSGAIAGLVGATIVLGSHYRFINNGLLAPSYGASGFMAALLSGGNPVGAAIGGLFFAALQTGGFAMQRTTDVPRVLAMVLQSTIILFLALRGGFTRTR